MPGLIAQQFSHPTTFLPTKTFKRNFFGKLLNLLFLAIWMYWSQKNNLQQKVVSVIGQWKHGCAVQMHQRISSWGLDVFDQWSATFSENRLQPHQVQLSDRKQIFEVWSAAYVLGTFQKAPGLFKTTQLRSCKSTAAHFCRKSYAEMRVSYAVQLPSNSVSKLRVKRGAVLKCKRALGLQSSWTDGLTWWTLDWLQQGSASVLLERRPYLACWNKHSCKNCSVGKTVHPRFSKQTVLEGSPDRQVRQWSCCIKFGSDGTNAAHFRKFSWASTFVVTKATNKDPLEAYFGNIRWLGRRSGMSVINQCCQFTTIVCTRCKCQS